MEQLTWTGSFSVLNPIFLAALAVFAVSVVAQIMLNFISPAVEMQDGALAAKKSPGDLAVSATRYCFFALIALILVF